MMALTRLYRSRRHLLVSGIRRLKGIRVPHVRELNGRRLDMTLFPF